MVLEVDSDFQQLHLTSGMNVLRSDDGALTVESEAVFAQYPQVVPFHLLIFKKVIYIRLTSFGNSMSFEIQYFILSGKKSLNTTETIYGFRHPRSVVVYRGRGDSRNEIGPDMSRSVSFV